MYPIDCFDINNTDRMEAVRYFIDINKYFIKETSKEEYELFSEFLKGEGRDILALMKESKTEKEFLSLFKKLEKGLPYASSISKIKTFEGKVEFIHKQLALRSVDMNVKRTSRESLKIQREMASEYDKLIDEISGYKQALMESNELRQKIADLTTMNKVFSAKIKGLGVNDIAEAIKNAVVQKEAILKEKRKTAFSAIREYMVKEQAYVIEENKGLETIK